MFIPLYLALMLVGAEALFAHPTSFEGSRGVMGNHAPQFSQSQINYSHTYWFATGFHHLQSNRNQEIRNAQFVSGNFLLKRWNGDAFQANLYSVLGLGNSQLSGQQRTSGMFALQFDIEDRDYYFFVRSQSVDNGKEREHSMNRVRFGFSPYVENYQGIHSWLILDWEEMQWGRQQKLTELTPFLRIFYRNLLFEIGQSFQGATKFNYITHF